MDLMEVLNLVKNRRFLENRKHLSFSSCKEKDGKSNHETLRDRREERRVNIVDGDRCQLMEDRIKANVSG